jgi:hypothetical protein
MEVRATRNRFGVRHLVSLFWAPRGPRSYRPPNFDAVKENLPRQVRWQEKENAYPAEFSFLSSHSANQLLSTIAGGPSDVTAWDAFWNNTDSGSRQAAAAAELRGGVGADEDNVGPPARGALSKTPAEQ